jgi:hypothetical protein
MIEVPLVPAPKRLAALQQNTAIQQQVIKCCAWIMMKPFWKVCRFIVEMGL